VKRIVLCALLAFGIAALASAQGKNRWGWGFPGAPQPAAESASVTGNLTIVQGSLAVKSGDVTYFVPGLMRYVGFIDSLKDGAQVRLEGAAVTVSEDGKTKKLMASKLTIGGKDYDLSRPRNTQMAPAMPMMPRRQMMHGWSRR
jgi:hypothetical protein